MRRSGQARRTTPRRLAARARSAALIGVTLAVSGSAAAVGSALIAADRWYATAMLNEALFQLSLFTLLGALGLAVNGLVARWGRKRIAAGVLAALVGVCGLAAATGVPRAPRSSPGDGERTVSVLSYNAFAMNRSPEDALSLIDEADADIVVLLEPPPALVGLLANHAELKRRYALSAPLPRVGGRLILARGTKESFREGGAPGPNGYWYQRVHGALIRTHAGPLAVVSLHPPSPRDAEAWARGSARAEYVGAWIGENRDLLGDAVVAVGDMNGTPSSTRTRGFCRTTGLRLCKGRLDPRGTWPARLPAWASAPIDHVFASDGIRMVSRRVLGSGGSDHRALMVEIALPRGP